MSDPDGTVSGFLINGADGKTITIPDGDFYINPKSRCRRLMLNSLSKEARQVYACLELGTMGFHQELAVIQERINGKTVRRPMTTTDISRMTGLDDGHVRRGFNELVDAGLAERRSTEGPGGPLQVGTVELYSYAEPRSPRKVNRGPRAAPYPDWAPESWKPLISLARRWKISLPDNIEAARGPLAEEVEEAVRGLQKAEEEAERVLAKLCAQAPTYKDERTERTRERTVVPSSSEFEGQDAPSSSSNQPLEPTTTVSNDFPKTSEAIQDATGFHEHDVVDSLVDACLQERPDATDDEIAAKVHEKQNVIRKGTNPNGMLLTAVPKTFRGGEFLKWRAARKQQAERIRTNTQYQAEPEPPPDPVVERTNCKKCGGVIERYQSGSVSPCACGARRRAGVSA